MHGSQRTPTARTPFRAASTPPRAPLASLPRSPTRLRPDPDDYDYPESPTRGLRRLSASRQEHEKDRPMMYAAQGGGNRRKPRVMRTARRAALCLLVVGLVLLVTTQSLSSGSGSGERLKGLRARWAGEEETVCRFVSPVEAYHRDLDRLQRLYPHRIRPNTFPDLASPGSISNTTIYDHLFAPTGHLLVSPNSSSPHPIPLLLALGETKWETLLANQSRTLPGAVAEYTRRYHRPPPRGFDIWWDFAQTHNLVLPDEYDRINLDLAPFFALPKEEMKRRMEMVENMPETFTIVVEQGLVGIQILDQGGLKWDGTLPRAKDAASLLEVFSRFLPDLKATFSIFDQPQIYLSWARRESLVKLGLEGEHTSHLQETDGAHVRLSRSCPPDSNLRMNVSHPEGKSFIYDSLEAGDICHSKFALFERGIANPTDPYVVPLHGLTLEPHGHGSHPKPHTQLLPLFSLAKTSINSDILITPLDQFHDAPGKDPKWQDKSSSKLAWRGSPTGISMMTRDLDWRNAHRVRLHHFANDPKDEMSSYLVPDLGQADDDADLDVEMMEKRSDVLGSLTEEASAREIAEYYYDIKLAGGPLQCSDSDGTCSDMWREISFAGYQPSSDLNKHKFLLDIDGNGWSGRFRRLMSTNSVVIKASLFTEWFQPHLIPWFMYVPAKLDFSDLTDIMAFFTGTPKHPALAFDETAQALARNGQCFAKRMFRIEDLQAYMMRLFLEYARIVADEGIDMDFHLDEPSDPRDYALIEDELDGLLPEQEQDGNPAGPFEDALITSEGAENPDDRSPFDAFLQVPAEEGKFGWEREDRDEAEVGLGWTAEETEPDVFVEERLNQVRYVEEWQGGQEVFAAR